MKTVTCDVFAINPAASPSNWSFDLMLIDGRFPLRGGALLPVIRVAARSIHNSHGRLTVEVGSGSSRREFLVKCRRKPSRAYYAKTNQGGMQ